MKGFLKQLNVKNQIDARDPSESNRGATKLELLFDLVYVVAISAAAEGLYNQLSQYEFSGLITFTLAFFILWNAWTSFTWFASGYDPNDSYYRISVLFQMFGSLLIASNIHEFFEDGLTWVGVLGYAIMRLASCTQWWRVYAKVSEHKTVAKRSILGLTFLQAMWISWLFIPDDFQLPALILFIIAELAMPIWARTEQVINWHPAHLSERYSLLVIIVLGEGIVGISSTMQDFITISVYNKAKILMMTASLITLLFCCWWVYFKISFSKILEKSQERQSLIIFGYGHFFIYASLTGLGASFHLISKLIQQNSSSMSHPLSATYVITMIMIQLALYLASLCLLRALILKPMARNLTMLLVSLFICVMSIFIVSLGVPVIYGICLSICAPVSVILWCEFDRYESE